MTDDERRLLLACASVLLAQLNPNEPSAPSEEVQAAVLRRMLEPFTDFIRQDLRRARADD